MERYILSKPYNMIHLCIHQYNEYIIKGVAYNNTVSESIPFHDINNLILQMDFIFDRNGNPQASRQTRSFQSDSEGYSYQNKPRMCCPYEDLLQYQGDIITLDIIVLSRRQSSWQGKIFYGQKEIDFQSALEMIKFINQLIDSHND